MVLKDVQVSDEMVNNLVTDYIAILKKFMLILLKMICNDYLVTPTS